MLDEEEVWLWNCRLAGVTPDAFDAGHIPTPVSLSTFPDVQLLNLGTFNLPANA